MNLEEIFEGMDQGPKDINGNFELIKQAIIDNQDKIGSNEFKIETYPLVAQNGWQDGGKQAFTLISNGQINIMQVWFELHKPKGVEFTNETPVASDPLISSHGFGWSKIACADWNNATIFPVSFHDNKVYVEQVNGNWKDYELLIQVDHTFVWKK